MVMPDRQRDSSGVVLVVEDDPQVRSLVRTLLAGDGYRVVEAGTGQEGLEVAEQLQGRFDLLISDMLLPELSGFDLASRLRERWPDLKVLFMTGYVEGEIVQRCVEELGAEFLDKPFTPSTMRRKVRELISFDQPIEKAG